MIALRYQKYSLRRRPGYRIYRIRVNDTVLPDFRSTALIVVVGSLRCPMVRQIPSQGIRIPVDFTARQKSGYHGPDQSRPRDDGRSRLPGGAGGIEGMRSHRLRYLFTVLIRNYRKRQYRDHGTSTVTSLKGKKLP